MLLISIKGDFFLLKFNFHIDPEFLLREISQNIFLFIYWKKSINTEFKFPLKHEKWLSLENVIQRHKMNSRSLK